MTRTFIRSSDELFRIVLADGRSVEATGEHPFWVEGKGFVLARYLARSDLLRDEDGRRVPVARITSRTGRFTVYNFEVEPTHTYYAAGWWVHNQCPRPNWATPGNPSRCAAWTKQIERARTVLTVYPGYYWDSGGQLHL